MSQLPMNPTAPDWMNKIQVKALDFAAEAHAGQHRKYTGEPYIYHPLHVAELLNEHIPSRTNEMVIAALLHDTVEDTEVTFTEIEREFGDDVADLVYWLTDNVGKENGNRHTRKRLAATFLAGAPMEAQAVKLCDLMSNTESIVEHDKDFARVYLHEKERLLLAMNKSAHKTGRLTPTEKYHRSLLELEFSRLLSNVFDTLKEIEQKRQDIESV